MFPILTTCFVSLVKGTEQLGKVVSYTTPYVISKMNKAPNNAPPVSGKAKTGIEIAKTATGVAVGVTGFVANKVGRFVQIPIYSSQIVLSFIKFHIFFR